MVSGGMGVLRKSSSGGSDLISGSHSRIVAEVVMTVFNGNDCGCDWDFAGAGADWMVMMVVHDPSQSPPWRFADK